MHLRLIDVDKVLVHLGTVEGPLDTMYRLGDGFFGFTHGSAGDTFGPTWVHETHQGLVADPRTFRNITTDSAPVGEADLHVVVDYIRRSSR